MKRILLCLVVLTVSLTAEETANGLGFAAGQLAGIGFSYRYLPDNYGFQVSFGVLSLKQNNDYQPTSYRGSYDPDKWLPPIEPYPISYNTRDTHANIGVLLFKVLHSAKRSRFYLFTGGSIMYNESNYKEQYYGYTIIDASTFEYGPVGKPNKRTEKESTRYFGLGIGMEYKLTDNIRIAVEWPLSYTSKGDWVMYIPQGGLHYFFK
ncbi:MAG: hypothetical protein ONB12_13080 [candidate division KSB1 bacterium]|nr:hypothetical protein [candidate division KSB1 bacterium]